MEKQIFIKVENIATPLQSYQVISYSDDIISSEELLNKISEHYGFSSNSKQIRLELWSGPIGTNRVRLDTLKNIPDKYTNIWVRGYLITHDKSEDRKNQTESNQKYNQEYI